MKVHGLRQARSLRISTSYAARQNLTMQMPMRRFIGQTQEAGAGRVRQGPGFGPEFRAKLLDLFLWRRDVRQFKQEPLQRGTLERLFELANLAPSVGLSQPWRFVIVESAASRAAIRACFECCNADALRRQSGDRASLYARLKLAGLDDAPCQFAAFADHATIQGHGLGRFTMPATIEYSAVMAIHTLWLAARAEGIGLGWVSILDPTRVASILETPREWTFVGYFCLGYPIDEHDVPTLERQGWEFRRPVSLIWR
jgi:5,6-dimethylbenzimidazole synthase